LLAANAASLPEAIGFPANHDQPGIDSEPIGDIEYRPPKGIPHRRHIRESDEHKEETHIRHGHRPLPKLFSEPRGKSLKAVERGHRQQVQEERADFQVEERQKQLLCTVSPTSDLEMAIDLSQVNYFGSVFVIALLLEVAVMSALSLRRAQALAASR